MTFNAYTLAFIVFSTVHHGIETFLEVLQDTHLKKRKDRVPKHLEGKVDLDTVRKAVAYNRAKLKFRMIMRFAELIPLWIMILFGFSWLDEVCEGFGFGPVATGLTFLGIFGVASGLLDLPKELYFTFVIEQKYGFNKQRLGGFILDKLKGAAVGAVLGAALVVAVLAIMERTEYWWALAFGVVAVFQLLMMWIYPLLIMPIFNKFEPVEGGILDAVKGLANNVGFPLKGVVKMDGSRRSGHSNAFIIGFKGARRIVLFDTLMEKLGTTPLVAVLAHELGHFKLGHIRRRLWAGLILGFLTFRIFGWMAGQGGMYSGLGFARESGYGALVVFSLLFSEVSYPFGYVARVLSRRDEFAADKFAVQAVGNGDDLKEALVSLTKQNLTSPGSHRLYRAWYNSHPSLKERLQGIDRVK